MVLNGTIKNVSIVSPNMTYHRILKSSNVMEATSKTGTVEPSRISEFIPGVK